MNRLGQRSHCKAANVDEYVDFIRRVQTPFYEEARMYFDDPEFLDDFSDSNEVAPYFPEQLEKIAKKYSVNS